LTEDDLVIVIGLTVALAAVAAFWDWRTGLIPNWLTLPPLLLAPLLYFFVQGGDPALFSALGILGGGLPAYVLFRMGAIGGGDVKLFGALGAINGFVAGTEMFALTMFVAALQACLLLFARGRLGAALGCSWQIVANVFRPASRRRSIAPEAMTEMRLGPSILVGAVLAIVIS
jgi:prepilin peptidase CpaA